MTKQKTPEQRIEEAIAKWEDRFDYSKATFKDNKITFTCYKHGLIENLGFRTHMKNGCSECLSDDKDVKYFNKKLKEISEKGNFDLSKCNMNNFNGKNTLITIKCLDCDNEQTAKITYFSDKRWPSCSKCKASIENKKTITWDDIINDKYDDKKFNKLKGDLEYCKNKFNDKYSYENIAYISDTSILDIYCKKHKTVFKQKLRDHKRGTQPCPLCKVDASHEKGYSIEDFINKSQQIHGYKYLYDKVSFNKVHDHVDIYCLYCNEYFSQLAYYHMGGNGHKKCSNLNKKGKNNFLMRAYTAHGDKYNYDKVIFKTNRDHVNIYCKRCDEYFEQRPDDHTRNGKPRGHKKCSNKDRNDSFTKPKAKVKEDIINKFGGMITDVIFPEDYKNMRSSVYVICKRHGKVKIASADHAMRSPKCCPKCGDGVKTLDEVFIKLINRFRGKYSYPFLEEEYENGNSIITISCFAHGIFKTTVKAHLSHQHCSECTTCEHCVDYKYDQTCYKCCNVKKYIKLQEYATKKFLEEQFPDLNIIHNKQIKIPKKIQDKYKSDKTYYYPDFLISIQGDDNYNIIIEVDENKHDKYDKKLEKKRMQMLQETINEPCIFIRYYPGEYPRKLLAKDKLKNKLESFIDAICEKDIYIKYIGY